MAPDTCESCGSTGNVVFAVHRMYVTPADWDTEGREVVVDEVERWCVPCCTMYPHRPAAGDNNDGDGDDVTGGT